MTRTPWSRNPHRDRIRRYVLARDGTICWICGKAGANSVDHLTPRSAGGSDDPSNLAAAHLSCNSRRGTTPLAAPMTSRHY